LLDNFSHTVYRLHGPLAKGRVELISPRGDEVFRKMSPDHAFHNFDALWNGPAEETIKDCCGSHDNTKPSQQSAQHFLSNGLAVDEHTVAIKYYSVKPRHAEIVTASNLCCCNGAILIK
jgi:hypothetical protein